MNNIEQFDQDEQIIKNLMNDLKQACDSYNGSVILKLISSINKMVSKLSTTVNSMLNINNNLEFEKLENFEERILLIIKLFEKTICKSSFCKTIKISDNCKKITDKLIILKDEVNMLKKLSVIPTAKQVNQMKKNGRKSSIKLNKYQLSLSESNSNKSYNQSTVKSTKIKPRFSVVAREVSANVNNTTTAITGSKKKNKSKAKNKKSSRNRVRKNKKIQTKGSIKNKKK